MPLQQRTNMDKSDFDVYGALADLHNEEQERLYEHRNFRLQTWKTRSGDKVQICNMEDLHLLNAYKLSGDKSLFKEMVVRLFEAKIKGTK